MTGTVDQYEMANVLTRRIEVFARLSQDDRALLDRIARRTTREVSARRDIIREGDAPRSVLLVLDGWACRYKTLPDGRRQIVAFFVPGDICDPHVYMLKEMDHSIASITPLRLAEIARDDFEKLIADHPRLVQALWWDELVTMAIQREWTLNLGQRTAFERIAHLLCELYMRLHSIGQTNGNSMAFPLTQVDLADATGLTAVHVNRTLQELRKAGLIELQSKTLTIPNMGALKDAAMFNDNYLHLEREGRHLDAND